MTSATGRKMLNVALCCMLVLPRRPARVRDQFYKAKR